MSPLPLTNILQDVAPGYHFASNEQKVDHLLFMDDLLYASNEKSLESLIQTVRAFSNDIVMESEATKCVVLTMKKGKMANSDEMALPNKTTMKGLRQGDSYNYLKVLRADGTKHHEVKEKVKTESRALNPKSDVARIYLSRKEGGRGLISVEDIAKWAILGLK